jgi:Meckel syndrome type 1 protein
MHRFGGVRELAGPRVRFPPDMKHTSPRFARAGLLLAAAALPLAPLAAQDAQPAPPPPAAQQPPAPPVVDVPAPPAPVATAPAPAPAPAATAPAPASSPVAAVRAPRAAPVRAARPAPRPAPRAIAPAPVAVAAPATTTTTTTSAPATVAVTPPPAASVPAATVPETIPAAPATGVDTVAPPAPRQAQPALNQRTATWPWLVLGALLIAAAALLFARRRRTRSRVYEEAYVPEAEPVAVAPAVAAVPAAAAEPAGAPDIALRMRPVRAGVAGDDARVEFELTVDNRGSAPARDVRVSTWMLAAGSSEAEQALIEPRAAADTAPVTLGAGEARTVEAQVALPTSQIDGDAVLPVVVADARYLLPDGSEAHATARFAVGVPDGEELAHFDTEHPSGLHEGVVAQALGETERA